MHGIECFGANIHRHWIADDLDAFRQALEAFGLFRQVPDIFRSDQVSQPFAALSGKCAQNIFYRDPIPRGNVDQVWLKRQWQAIKQNQLYLLACRRRPDGRLD